MTDAEGVPPRRLLPQCLLLIGTSLVMVACSGSPKHKPDCTAFHANKARLLSERNATTVGTPGYKQALLASAEFEV